MSESYTLTLYNSDITPENSAITQLVFGAYGANNSWITSSQVNFGSSTDGGTITSSGGAGVYRGVTSSAWAPSTTETANDATASNDITTDYLAATQGCTVTISFDSTQEYFGMLWGSVNSGNTLTFYNGSTVVATITADELVSTYGATYQDNYYAAINIAGGYTKVMASSTSGGFEFTDVGYASTTIANPTTGTGTTNVTPYYTSGSSQVYLCFLAGTRIATPAGEAAVESLKEGDLVTTLGGTAQPVRWLGKRRVSARFADPLRAYPIRLRAGALADGVPSRDLLLSPDHALLVDGILAQAGALVNGVSIVRETEAPESFTYYHVEVAEHSLILAENTPAETFVDNVDRMAFDNWEEYVAVVGDTSIPEMEYPRAKSARQVPQATRARLAARAEALYGAERTAA